jgi:AcrR family transcriptional regulator
VREPEALWTRSIRLSGSTAQRIESKRRRGGIESSPSTERHKFTRGPGRPTSTSGLYAREKLLEAATELFAKQGVAATTFAMIAERAGLTPAMLHYYFRDREQMLDAVVEERLAPLIAGVWGPVAADETPAELMRGIVERMLAGIEKMPWVPSTWMREVLNEGGLLRGRVLRHLPLKKIGALSQSVAGAQANGTANTEIDPGLIVFSLIGLVMMHMATIDLWAEVFGRKAPNREALNRHITGLLIHGLQRGDGLKAGEGRKPGEQFGLRPTRPVKRKAGSKRK